MEQGAAGLAGRISRALRGMDSAMATMLLVSLTVYTLFLVVPLAAVVFAPLASSDYTFFDLFRDPTMVRLENTVPRPFLVKEFHGVTIINIQGPRYGVVVNSLVIAASVTLLATLIGIAVAFVFARYDFPGKTILRVLAVVPLLYTPFINAFVVSKVFKFGGLMEYVLNHLLGPLGVQVRLNIGGMAGVILAQTMMFWPIAYLNVYASMMQIDPSLEEQAENLGARGFTLFRKVTLPLSLPGIAAGAAIIFIFSMEDLAAPLAFNFHDVMSYRIFDGIKSAPSGRILPSTSALALLLLLLALAAFIGIRRYVTLRQYAMLSRGGRWNPRVRRPEAWRLAVIYLVLIPWMLFSATPQIGTFIYALSESWNKPIPEGFPTLQHFREAVSDKVVVRAFLNSVTYATTAILVIVVVALASAYVVARLNVKGISALDALVTSPIAIPGLAIATGYLLFFTSGPFREGALARLLNPFVAGPAALFVIAYTVRRSPFTTRAVYAGLQQTHVALEEAAMNLGASRWTALRRIVMPLIGLNLLSGALVSFVYSIAEVSVSVSLGGLREGQEPLTYVMYDYLYSGVAAGPHLVAVMAVLIMAVQLTVITLTNIILRQRYAFIGV